MGKKVFIEITIGDEAAYHEAMAEYTRFRQYCSLVGPQVRRWYRRCCLQGLPLAGTPEAWGQPPWSCNG